MSTTAQAPTLFLRADDSGFYAVPASVLEQHKLTSQQQAAVEQGDSSAFGDKTLLVDVGTQQFAIPANVVEQYRAPSADIADLDKLMTNAEESSKANEVSCNMMTPWGLGAYAACFYAAWAGGGDAVAAGDYCWAKYGGG